MNALAILSLGGRVIATGTITDRPLEAGLAEAPEVPVPVEVPLDPAPVTVVFVEVLPTVPAVDATPALLASGTTPVPMPVFVGDTPVTNLGMSGNGWLVRGNTPEPGMLPATNVDVLRPVPLASRYWLTIAPMVAMHWALSQFGEETPAKVSTSLERLSWRPLKKRLGLEK